jgi:cytidylate kinase
VGKWSRALPKKDKKADPRAPVITLCMEPGSQGCLVSEKVAALLGFDLYNREIIRAIAKSMKTSTVRIDALEKERLSGIEDFIACLIEEKYLHNDIYMEHLVKVVNVIADHGNAVIVGRGANFILPFEQRFAARIIAPAEIRVANIVRACGATAEEARRRITRREARRRAFVRQSFNKDIRNPSHYDITLNTARLGVAAAAEAIVVAAVGSGKTPGVT